jgi:hypothetical protein
MQSLNFLIEQLTCLLEEDQAQKVLSLAINSPPWLHIIATMASKFMANAAFEARLLLRPSHQRTI